VSIVVEHEKRRYEILEQAIDVFMDEGFENTTFQKIADRCTITRTTLYVYFKNKKEIFIYSIKQLLGTVEQAINSVRNDNSLSYGEKIYRILSLIIDRLTENRRLLIVVLDYLRYLAKSKPDINIEKRVNRRVLRLRHILSSIVIEGIETRALKPVIIKDVDDMFYAFIEAAVFRLTVLGRTDISELKASVLLCVQTMETVD
jgi:AcrR family transcriptional regulator